MIYPELSKLVLDAAFKVHRVLGPGLLESPYHNALYYELCRSCARVIYNAAYEIVYEGETVGEYFADLAVEGKIILEIKAVATLGKEHEAQLLNYLHISGCSLGFLLNFSPRQLQFRRLVLQHSGVPSL